MKDSHIGLIKKQYKTVKFNRSKHSDSYLTENVEFIKLSYGVRPENFRPVDGKIVKIYSKGIEVVTDFGYMFPTWDRIKRLYLPKISQKQFKETKVKATNNIIGNVTGVLDGAINKIIFKTKNKFSDIKVQDDRIDLSTRYKRNTTFRIGRQTLVLSIDDINSKSIEITGTVIGKKSKLKPDKALKINSYQISNMMAKIKKLIRE